MNHLADELSPYLRQHRDNPVDWFPWGEEAFARARGLDHPVLISIGYAACHWCHVMAHESFENEAVAHLINDGFVAIKVDREERPDVDAVYLEAVQALQGQAGWPLTVFATPEGRPFFGGTYFPRHAAHGLPAFADVLKAVSATWTNRRDEIGRQADELTAAVAARLGSPGPATTVPDASGLVDRAVAGFAANFDPEYGGLGGAPKFPQAPRLELLLRAHRLRRPRTLEMATTTLAAMASGGIYDHLGGGFARYSVDRRWLVPHFEKMAYDQAALSRCYLHAWQVTGDSRWRQVLDETLGYVLDVLRDPAGGIRSSEDADSEGEEGRFYAWTFEELIGVLGAKRAALAAQWYGVGAGGNLDNGRSVLSRPVRGDLLRPAEVERCRVDLRRARGERVRPALDDKVVTEWNAMTCSVLAEAAAATGNTLWRTRAVELGEFLLAALRRPDGRWLRVWQAGRAAHLGVAADYAWLVDCFTRLGELTGVGRFGDEALTAAHELIRLFSAPDGGWYATGSDAETLVVRPRQIYDGVTPAAGSVAASALARLAAISGETTLWTRAEQSVAAAGSALADSPLDFAHLVEAAVFLELGAVEIVVVGDRPDLVAAASAGYVPERVLVWGASAPSPRVAGRHLGGAYVCRRGACLAPVTDPAEISAAIDHAVADATAMISM
ncbi:MAG TPA: thioredoxin domain-containing protein [Acidimicrobiales bacterium]|nr:thioredoxin domain-containing protein [Acidimicrobiales bacterium]